MRQSDKRLVFEEQYIVRFLLTKDKWDSCSAFRFLSAAKEYGNYDQIVSQSDRKRNHYDHRRFNTDRKHL